MPLRPDPVFGDGGWPQLTMFQFGFMVGVPIVLTIGTWVLLRMIWPPPEKRKMEAPDEGTPLKPTEKVIYLEEGEAAGDYSEDWTNTFDFFFITSMTLALVLLCIATQFYAPQIWSDGHFWLMQLPKVGTMIIVSLLGGLVCRYFCEVDPHGYIITNKNSAFKVNYTRKLQHFAAYAIPLFVHSGHSGPLALAWGDWFTLLGFLVLIKPIRESSTFFMLQFNSLDRPEDRPHTLKWIVAGNVFPGQVLILIFRYLYAFTNQEDLVLVWIMITGVGDGLAEPVGIAWGKHKYWTSGIGSDRKYQRSLEGSACVFLSGFVFSALYWYAFTNPGQMWVSAFLLSPLMAYAEAKSPHTIDTPFLMGVGGLLLLFITHCRVFLI